MRDYDFLVKEWYYLNGYFDSAKNVEKILRFRDPEQLFKELQSYKCVRSLDFD